MPEQIKFSIITVNFNNADGLQKTVASIERQTYKNFEWIFIDACSIDNSLIIAQSAAFDCKKVLSEKDEGIYDGMNKGIKLIDSTSRYVIFLNSGDCFAANAVLEETAAQVEKNEEGPDIIFGASVDQTRLGLRPKSARPLLYIYVGMIAHHQAIFFKTALLKEYNYSMRYKVAADYDLVCRCFAQGSKFKKVNYRICLFGSPGLSLDRVHQGRYEAFHIRKKVLLLNIVANSIVFIFQYMSFSLKKAVGYFGH